MAKEKDELGSTLGAVIAVTLIACCVVFVWYFVGSVVWDVGSSALKKAAGPNAPQIKPDALEKVDAYEAAIRMVRNNLVAPSTAKFPSFSYNSVRTVDYCTWIVTSYVDSQNSFGAMLRTNYKAKIMLVERPGQKPYWKMLDFKTY